MPPIPDESGFPPSPFTPPITPVPAIGAWWLGRTGYRDAWDLQHRLVVARQNGLIGDQLLLLEHEPVLTLGRNSDPAHVLADPSELARRNIELIETERGGEVTYHGPGQLTGYAIIKLADRKLLVRPLVRVLEWALSKTCASFGVQAGPIEGVPGCWCDDGRRKIGAVGVRIERGVSYHGIALNVTVRLSDFDLIDACGIPGVQSTSIGRELGKPAAPTTDSVARSATAFANAMSLALGAPLESNLAPAVEPRDARAGLEALLSSVGAASASPAAATAGRVR